MTGRHSKERSGYYANVMEGQDPGKRSLVVSERRVTSCMAAVRTVDPRLEPYYFSIGWTIHEKAWILLID